MAKILIIRLSSIGDVAMTIPVIYSVARAHPDDEFTVITQPFLIDLFLYPPENVELLAIDTKGGEKGLIGLLRFSMALTRSHYDVVIDLHDVLRSKVICAIFRLCGKRVVRLKKARSAARQRLKKPSDTWESQHSIIARYGEVFHRAGFPFEETFHSLFEHHLATPSIIESLVGEKKGRWIGIAPFAKHLGKCYPLEKMEMVVEKLSGEGDTTLFLFGARGEEEEQLREWMLRYPQTFSVVGRYSLERELALISKLDLMISMDSANMHFASLVATPVISIWGGTHPTAGFYGYRQPPHLAILSTNAKGIYTIYGKKPWYIRSWDCFTQITPDTILSKVNKYFDEL